MSDGQTPANRSTRSGIDVDRGGNDLGLTATVALSRKGMGLANKKQSKAPTPPPPPPAEAVKKLPYAVATNVDCGCPRCSSEFEIEPEFYNAVAECPECGLMFVIKPPGTPPFRGEIPGGVVAPRAPAPPPPPVESDNMLNTIEMQRQEPMGPAPVRASGAPQAAARGRRSDENENENESGIDTSGGTPSDYGLTATVTLSRRGMGMHQKRKNEAPPPPAAVASMPYSVASQDEVGCPNCSTTFEISPEFYNAVAECPECSREFIIKPPGTPPYRPSGNKMPVQSRASQSGPVPVPPGAQAASQAPARPAPPRPAPPRPAPPSAPPQRGPATPEAQHPSGIATPTDNSNRSGVASPKRRTETSIKQLDQLTAPAPMKKKASKGLLIGVIVTVIVLLIIMVGALIKFAAL